MLRLRGGAKKRKKKSYTTPKKNKHKRKKVKLAVLKYYKVRRKKCKGSVVKVLFSSGRDLLSNMKLLMSLHVPWLTYSPIFKHSSF